MDYNLSTQARLQAEKDICEELEKDGRVYIKTSLKALQKFEESLEGLDFYSSSWYSWQLARGKNGKYNKVNRRKRWDIH